MRPSAACHPTPVLSEPQPLNTAHPPHIVSYASLLGVCIACAMVSQGMSTSTEVMAEVKKAASAAKRVLVLLDSDHSAANVRVGDE